MPACPVCAADVRPAAKFCGKCGASVAGVPSAAPVMAAASPPVQSGDQRHAVESASAASVAPSAPAVPRRSAPRIPAVTSKSRAKLRLQAATSMEPAAVLDIVRDSSGTGKGGGVSLLTTGIANVSAGVHIETESETKLGLSITSGKRLIELCTFSAEVTRSGGVTSLRVGGLETYKTLQTKMYGFVPAGPKRIMGYDPYRHFLEETAARLVEADPAATIDFLVPD